MDRIRKNGIDYEKVTGGDAADASWEVGHIRSMGFSPIVREVEEGYFNIYLPVGEVRSYKEASYNEEKDYWHSPEGIDSMKTWGKSEKEFLRSPEGRLQKRQEKLTEKAMRRGEY